MIITQGKGAACSWRRLSPSLRLGRGGSVVCAQSAHEPQGYRMGGGRWKTCFAAFSTTLVASPMDLPERNPVVLTWGQRISINS